MNRTNTQRAKERLAEYARFGATGILNTGADFLIFNLLLSAFGPGTDAFAHAIFKAAGFLAAVTNSYFLNKHWVFGHKGKANHRAAEGGRFLAVSVAGFFLNVAVSTLAFYVLSERTGILGARAASNVGAALGAALTLVWNYIGYKAFVFKRPNHHEAHKEHTALGGHPGLQRIEADPQNAR